VRDRAAELPDISSSSEWLGEAYLDVLPSTEPLPTLRTRIANEPSLRGTGDRALFTLTNVFVMFGGSNDGAFNQEISDLVGPTRVFRTNWHTDAMAGHTFSGEDYCGRAAVTVPSGQLGGCAGMPGTVP
jgi:hypothetical protein